MLKFASSGVCEGFRFPLEHLAENEGIVKLAFVWHFPVNILPWLKWESGEGGGGGTGMCAIARNFVSMVEPWMSYLSRLLGMDLYVLIMDAVPSVKPPDYNRGGGVAKRWEPLALRSFKLVDHLHNERGVSVVIQTGIKKDIIKLMPAVSVLRDNGVEVEASSLYGGSNNEPARHLDCLTVNVMDIAAPCLSHDPTGQASLCGVKCPLETNKQPPGGADANGEGWQCGETL